MLNMLQHYHIASIRATFPEKNPSNLKSSVGSAQQLRIELVPIKFYKFVPLKQDLGYKCGQSIGLCMRALTHFNTELQRFVQK